MLEPHKLVKRKTMVVRSSSSDVTQPMLNQRRQDHLDSAHLQAPLRKMRVRVRRIGVKSGVAAAFGTLLFVAAITSFVPRSGTMARTEHESARHSDATLLLARAAGLSNPDEAEVLLEALENGTLDFAVLSSAMEEDASRKAAKIKEAAEMEASRKIAEEKAAFERSLAERATADSAAADKAAADKVVAAKAAAQKAVAEETSAEKAAAASKSSEIRKRASQSVDVFYDEDEDDEFFDRVEDENDWLWGDFDDEFDDDVENLPHPEGDSKRSTGFREKRGRTFLSGTKNGRVPLTKESRDTLDRGRSSSVFAREEENEEEEAEQLEDDDGFGDVKSKWSRPFRSNRRPRSSHASAAAADHRHFLQERVGQRKGGRGGGDGRRRNSRGHF